MSSPLAVTSVSAPRSTGSTRSPCTAPRPTSPPRGRCLVCLPPLPLFHPHPMPLHVSVTTFYARPAIFCCHSLCKREVEVCTDGLVVLYPLDNRVQRVLAYLKFRLEKCDEFFAIVRVHPHAILEAYEPDLRHCRPEPCPNGSSSFRKIECDHAPSPVPPALLILEPHLLSRESELMPACLRNPQIGYAVAPHPRSEPLPDKSGCDRLRIRIESPLVLRLAPEC